MYNSFFHISDTVSLLLQNEIADYAGTQQSLDEHKYGGDEGSYRAQGSNTSSAVRSLWATANSESECASLPSCLRELNISEEITEIKEDERERERQEKGRPVKLHHPRRNT